MEQLTTTNIMSLFETTKRERESFVMDLIERMEEGEVEPLRAHLQVKAMQSIYEGLNDNPRYKAAVLHAAEQHGKKFPLHSAEFSIREVGTKYDYSQCGDLELNALLSLQTSINEKVKNRQEFLKAAPVSGQVIVDSNGETYTVYPPSKSSTTSVAVSLK